ncbi:CHASE2 domain-containing protein [Allomesorhizobium camelthorni]|uniref:Adenylate/guanylate cyclase domain-containing protein n=1 Tax=Allomesorhizobium camelthorni TaxID=475069 RepID=A0A6G4W6Y0_9HYPH|nr:adenylate/guanylate cyclase domain-containing protein [Mesorhizobium camelthorni]NGO50006.1 adenylate/guanylate cyclase domain-containing protein [Mesorhizobium camelthorni]
MKRRALPTLIALLLAGLWGAGLGYLHWRGNMWFLDRIEATMTDVRTNIRGTASPPDLITIVAIDDELAKGEGFPLNRATLSRLIDEIARFDPKIIAVDLLLVDPKEKKGDEALARSLGGSTTVIAAAAVFAGGKQWIPPQADGPLVRLPDAERFLMPLQMFSDAAAVGVVNVATDQTGTPRFVPLLFRSGDQVEASLPLRVAALAIGTEPEIEPNRLFLGTRLIRTDLGHLLPLAFYGPRGTIPTISAAAVLSGQLTGGEIRNRIVVIGATATGGGDVFPTPFDPVLPGVEVISTAIAHLMSGDGIVRDRYVRLVDAGFAVVLPMVLVALVAWRRSAIGLAAVIGVVLIWATVNVTAFSNGIWLSAALPMAAAAPPAILFGAVQLWRDRNRAQYFATQSKLLQRVQAPGLGQWLAKHGDFLQEPVREDVAVVFIDLSGFTGLSETLGPNATRELLSAFHTLVDEEVTECGGIVTSFMGDGAMILFGLPEPAADDASRAASCSVRLSHRTRDWLASQPASTSSRLGYKIGAHFGTVIASRLGGESHQHIAATGDTVNIASRLMEVAASHRTELAVSDELLHVAGKDCDLYKAGVLQGPIETNIRGRSGSLAVWLWKDAEVATNHCSSRI